MKRIIPIIAIMGSLCCQAQTLEKMNWFNDRLSGQSREMC